MLQNPVVVFFCVFHSLLLFGWEIGPELFMILILKILKIGYFSRHFNSLLVIVTSQYLRVLNFF